MKTIICGSRNIKVTNEMMQEIIYISQLNVTEIISGCAKGPDSDAIRYAIAVDIPLQKFSADWNQYGKVAGAIRNQQMVNEADAMIAIWDGMSKGTLDSINKAKKKKLAIFIYKVYGTPKTERINY